MHKSHHRIKVVDGVEHYQCSCCYEHFPREGYSKSSRAALGIPPQCKECNRKRHRRRREENLEAERARCREAAARRRASQAEWSANADVEYERVMLKGGAYADVPVEGVRQWLESIMPRYESQEAAARDLGLPARRLYSILNGECSTVRFETADKIALAAGETDALGSLLVQGRPDWSRDHTHCIGCGTFWHPHFARGMCRQCYSRHYEGVHALPRDQRWSLYHSCCRDCERTSVKHRARGLCMSCYSRHSRRKTLDQFPNVRPS